MFQEDLKNGLSIEEALKKYNISFRDAVSSMPRQSKRDPIKSLSAGRYIQKRRHIYHLRKTVNGESRYYGAYNSFKDAKTIRDYLIETNWECTDLDEICKKFGIERNVKKGGRY